MLDAMTKVNSFALTLLKLKRAFIIPEVAHLIYKVKSVCHVSVSLQGHILKQILTKFGTWHPFTHVYKHGVKHV